MHLDVTAPQFAVEPFEIESTRFARNTMYFNAGRAIDAAAFVTGDQDLRRTAFSLSDRHRFDRFEGHQRESGAQHSAGPSDDERFERRRIRAIYHHRTLLHRQAE